MPADPRDRLIVALDVDSLDSALGLVERLDGIATRFKIGSQLFTAAGPAAVEAVKKRGGEVFLDLKYHDIPNTVAGAAREAARLGPGWSTPSRRSRGGAGPRIQSSPPRPRRPLAS